MVEIGSNNGQNGQFGNYGPKHTYVARHPQNPYPTQTQPYKKPQLMEYFGIFHKIPTLNLLKLWGIICLFVLVELNIVMNLEWTKFIGEEIYRDPKALLGVGFIGIFLGMFYRYIEFEFENLRWVQVQYGRAQLMDYLKLIFFISIMIIITLWIIFELVFTMNRFVLVFIDLMSITAMAVGTYALISGKRHLTIIPMIFVFLIMLLGIGYKPELPILLFLGLLTLMYIEVADGACRIQEHLTRAYKTVENTKHPEMLTITASIDQKMEKLTIQYIHNLGLFMGLTILITGLFLAIFTLYPVFTPAFMHENLELQSVYAVMPIFLLLFVVFLILYLSAPRSKPSHDHNLEM